ncbi:putative ribosomally synthesized peptide with SipW-like signal peptide [Salana multivorans]|uniref:Putative ribosomally synthesized peptide with SipW-like signal peptide n=1 Tax=Salana multivorans TaxID=120377 RepID=A0A3N2DBS2_9MICO|nr:TasA family protein [Salana multivorans]ROR97193.1 putative ribosomally synthesized peptide with SipW-like signal peptide [Salana multivorans]
MSISISPRLRILAAAGVVAVMAVGGSMALFSDSGTVRTTLTAGTLDLKFDADQDGSPDPYVIVFEDGDVLAPGVEVTQDLVVYNSGSVNAALALAIPVVDNDATGDDLLQDELELTITDAATSTELYSGPLTEAAFTDFAIGANGTTATGHTLTLAITVSSDAPVEIAGQEIQIDLPFTATQTLS